MPDKLHVAEPGYTRWMDAMKPTLDKLLNESSDVIAENVEDNIPAEGVFKFGDHRGYIKMPDNYSQSKKYPFMIIHGDKDGIVTKSNSDILVSKMKDKKISVEYLIVKDVSHSNKIINGLEDRVLDYFDAFK